VLGVQLNSVIFKFFSNLNDSTILCTYTLNTEAILNSQNLSTTEFCLEKEYIFCVNSKYLIKNSDLSSTVFIILGGRKEGEWVGVSWDFYFVSFFLHGLIRSFFLYSLILFLTNFFLH